MLIASTMGATAFQKGLGAMHSLSHPCGANLNTHHGLTNAVVMPYVLGVESAARSSTRCSGSAPISGLDEALASMACWTGCSSCVEPSEFPTRSPTSACSAEHAAAFAPQAFADLSTGGNPLPMDTPNSNGST